MPGSPPRARPTLGALAFAATAVVAAAALLTALAVATAAARRGADEAARERLEQAADLTAQLLAGRGRSLAGGARVFVQGPYFRALVAERRRDDILDQAFEAAEQLEAAWVFITDERGALLAKSDEPGAAGDDLGGLSLVAGALGGNVMGGFGVTGDSALFQVVAVPIVVPGAAPVGALVATRLVDARLARDIRAATSADVVFFALDARGAAMAAASTLPDSTAATVAERAATGAAPSALTLGDTTYAAQRAAVATAGGDVVGGYVVLRAREAEPPGLAGVRRALAAGAAVGLLLAAGVAAAVARRVARPLAAAARAVQAGAAGDHDAAARRAAVAARGALPGEPRALADAAAALLGELRDRHRVAALVRAADARRPAAAGAAGPAAAAEAADAATTPAGPPPRAGGASVRAAGPRQGARQAALAVAAPRGRALRIGAVPEAGDLLAGRYAVEAELGRGGTGIVYRAVDRDRDALVAVKVLRPELVAADPLAAERLEHELRLARRVSHRNVVRTIELREGSGDVPFVVMEYVDGPALDDLLRALGPLDQPSALAVATQLARALDAAHAQGVIHGDLKPANVLLGRDGLLRVADFGVAALARARTAHEAGGSPAGAAPRAQLAGAVVGTPEYLAPEVLLGSPPDVRADLYSAGMVLHECLTGATPYRADTPREFLARKLEPAAGPAPPEPPLPGGPLRTLAAAVSRLTARDRDRRPPSAAALLAMLAALDRGRGEHREQRPQSRLGRKGAKGSSPSRSCML